jgi:hypothetical protein
MSTRSLLTFALATLLAVACGESSAPPSPLPSVASGEPRASVSALPPPPAPASLAPSQPEVAGLVVDDADEPIVGRPVVLIDRRGRRTDVLTDDGGVFHVADVLAPYDVALAPAPSGSVLEPVAFLGLRRRDPRIVLNERDGDAAPPSHLVRVEVALPPCADDGCWIGVATASPSGAGAAGRIYGAAESTASFEIDHAWNVDDLAFVEPIDVHVLTADAANAQFAYGRAGGVDGTPGDASDVAVAPQPVASSAPIALGARGAGVPQGWDWFLASRLLLPGGPAMTLRIVAGPALVARFPLIDGARFDLAAWAQHPEAADRPWFQEMVTVASSAFSFASREALIDMPDALAIGRPQPEGHLARRGAGIAWTSARPCAATVALRSTADDTRVVRVHTSEQNVSFGRLELLGIARPLLGEHVLDVAARWDADVDSITDPNGPPGAPVASSYARFAVTVTP